MNIVVSSLFIFPKKENNEQLLKMKELELAIDKFLNKKSPMLLFLYPQRENMEIF